MDDKRPAAQHSIVIAKLTKPEMNHIPLHRNRLYQRLDQGIGQSLTAVVAPPGYGKSALLNLWARQRNLSVGWFHIDEDDQALGSFLAYMIHAIPVWPAEITQQCAELLWTCADQGRDLFLSDAVSKLMENLQQFTEETTVILDGYEHIHNPEIHRTLSRLLAYAPPHFHLIVSSRTALPIAEGRVVDWDYVHIGASELAMTPHETAAYLMKNNGLSLKEDDLHDLYEQTRGWATGINATLALMRQTGAGALNEPFFREQLDDRLADYFQAQIMNGLSAENKALLMRWSVPETIHEAMTAELHEMRGDSLADAADNGWFLLVSPGNPRTHSLHPLFRRFLRRQLEHKQPELYAALNRACMSWFEDHGFYAEAAGCAQQIGDDDALAAIIVGHPAELLQDENLYLLRLLDYYPTVKWKASPVLAWLYAVALVHSRKYLKAEQLLDLAEAAVAEQGCVRLPTTGENLIGYIYSERSRIHFSRNEPEIGLRYTQKTGEALGGPGKLHGMLHFHPHTTSLLNSPYGFWGAVPSSRLLMDYCEPLWKRNDAGYAVVLVVSGECRYETGELNQAHRFLGKGLTLGLELNEPGVVVPAYITLAKMAWCERDKEAAYAILQEARDQLVRMNRKERVALIDACEIDLRIREGHLKPVRLWVAGRPVSLDAAVNPYRMFESIVMLRSLFALGRTSQAREYGQRLLRSAESNRLSYHIVEILLLLAQNDRQRGNLQMSSEKLEGALEVASAQGYVQLFALEGSLLARLLENYLNHSEKKPDNRAIEYARMLMKDLPDHMGTTTIGLPKHLISHLSGQEARVCRLIAEGMMNKQIAECLGISMETVKKHCQSIYRKLGIRNRQEVGKLMLAARSDE